MDHVHSEVHNSVGSVAKAALPTEIILVGHHLRIMIATTGNLVDHLSHNTIRATSRSLIEVMATPEDIISQRVTVSLNQNGCSYTKIQQIDYQCIDVSSIAVYISINAVCNA